MSSPASTTVGAGEPAGTAKCLPAPGGPFPGNAFIVASLWEHESVDGSPIVPAACGPGGSLRRTSRPMLFRFLDLVSGALRDPRSLGHPSLFPFGPALAIIRKMSNRARDPRREGRAEKPR